MSMSAITTVNAFYRLIEYYRHNITNQKTALYFGVDVGYYFIIRQCNERDTKVFVRGEIVYIQNKYNSDCRDSKNVSIKVTKIKCIQDLLSVNPLDTDVYKKWLIIDEYLHADEYEMRVIALLNDDHFKYGIKKGIHVYSVSGRVVYGIYETFSSDDTFDLFIMPDETSIGLKEYGSYMEFLTDHKK